MASFRRLGIILLVGAVAIIFAGMFDYTSISDRILVLGIGIDNGNDGTFYVTYEAAIPSQSSSDSSSQNDSGGRLVYGSGPTLALALEDAESKVGSHVSLGQTSVILLGEDFIRNRNISATMSYFTLSNAFRNGTPMAACIGSAKEILSTQQPFGGYIGLTLQKMIQSGGSKLSIPTVTINDFQQAQISETGVSYLPLLRFLLNENPASVSNEQSEKPSGYFSFDEMAVFKYGELKFIADKELKNTFMLVNEKTSYQTFEVDNYTANQIFPRQTAVGTKSKKISQKYSIVDGTPVVNVDISIIIKKLKTDTDSKLFKYNPMNEDEIRENHRLQVSNIINKSVTNLYNTAQKEDCDFLNIYSGFYRELANEWKGYAAIHPDWLKKLRVEIAVDIQ